MIRLRTVMGLLALPLLAGCGTELVGNPVPQPSGVAAVVAAVAESCVQPGADQTVIVRTGRGLRVGVDPQYADGKLGDFYGGLALARPVGPEGLFRETWTLPENTPAGPVTVLAGITGGSPRAEGRAMFTVAAHC